MLKEPSDRVEFGERLKNNKRVLTKRKIAFFNDLKKSVDVFCYVNLIYCYLLDYSIFDCSIFTLVLRSCMQSYLSNTLPFQISKIGLPRRKKRQLLKISYFAPLFFNLYILLLRSLFYVASKYNSYHSSFKLTYFVIGETQVNFFSTVISDIFIILSQCLLFSLWYNDAKQHDPDLVPAVGQNEQNESSQQHSITQKVTTNSEPSENNFLNLASCHQVPPNENHNGEQSDFSVNPDIYNIQNDNSEYEDGYSGNINIEHVNLVEVLGFIWNLRSERETTNETSMDLDSLLQEYVQNQL